ncbi:hypothetical protein NB459_06235 [Clostridioides difficile]|uniref:hypothetical protein n=1 Tax=Clostridioides difficile TaxID=1496 RepID=UPI00202DC1CD|nr:hypothetical protein [Clostridioides difficile]MCM0744924.1 hypothetical protein [Clostridioides difficile]
MNLIFCIIATGLVENLMFPIILMITISIVCFEIAINFLDGNFLPSCSGILARSTTGRNYVSF